MPKTFGEPVFAPITSAVADTTIVAAQGAGITIRVLGFVLVAAAAATATFQSGVGGTALTGPLGLVAGVEIEADIAPFGWFETAANAVLNLHQTGAVQLSGFLVWCPAS
jgi:hypothetical protein